MNTLRAIHLSCVLALLSPANAAAERAPRAERAASQPAASGPHAAKRISTLYLFVHPMPRRAPIREEYMAKWEKLFAAEGPKEENVICVLSNSPPEMELLRNMAKKYFGQRCIIDPSDNSLGTRMLLLGDLERTLSTRGNYGEWVPYEIWASNNARRWAEGFRKELDNRGLTYDPAGLRVIACGQQWTGCLTKYANFFTK